MRLTYLYAATATRPKRWVAACTLRKSAALLFVVNSVVALVAGAGVAGALVIGFFCALGPFFLAGLLNEKTGVWLALKDQTAVLALASSR